MKKVTVKFLDPNRPDQIVITPSAWVITGHPDNPATVLVTCQMANGWNLSIVREWTIEDIESESAGQ